MRYNQKRVRKSSERAQLWIFTPYFFKFRAFRMLHPLKTYVFGVFIKKYCILFLNKGTACRYRMQYVAKISPDYFSLQDDYSPFLQLVYYTNYLHSSATIFDKLKAVKET